MSLIELMVSVFLAGIVLTMVMLLFMFGLRSFAAMGNYAELNGQSRHALDVMSKEIRQSSHVLGAQSNGDARWLIVANTNVVPAVTNIYSWAQGTGVMRWDRMQGGRHTIVTNLTSCDMWDFTMCIRSPDAKGVFPTTQDPSRCKLINMSWKCTRSILGKKVNSESVLTAEIVLRNKHEL